MKQPDFHAMIRQSGFGFGGFGTGGVAAIMTVGSDAVVVYVTYQGNPTSRFDRDYYVNHHLPLVMQAWQPHGLLGVAAFFPAVDQDGTIAICECRFRDRAALDAALGSPMTATVMADLPRFTDATPQLARAAAL
jgi:uncharacterized protein (TIGR02118 family)